MHSFAFVNRFTTILPSRRTIKLVEKEMKTFDDLIYLNEQDKQLIRDSIQIYYSQIQRIRANALFFGGITWGILFYIVLAILLIFWNQILSLYFKVHSYNINLSIEFTGNNAQIYLPTFIPIVFFTSVFSLGLFVILSTIITIIFKLETRGLLITSFISVLIPEIICFSIINNSYSNSIILFNSSTYNLLSGLVAIMIFSPFSFLLFFSVAIVIFVYKTIQKSHYPIAVVISNLISILDHVKDHEKDWIELKYKQIQLLRLEEAAECIAYYLPIRLESGDLTTDKWMKEDIFEQVANALRDKKKWVITPKKDTYEHFVKYIASTLFNIANGNWDALERIKPEKITPRQLWRSRILDLLKTLFIALVPWALLWVLQLPPFKLEGTILIYLSIIAYVWAAFTVIAAIDPTFSLKISAVKDITSIIIPTGKNSNP